LKLNPVGKLLILTLWLLRDSCLICVSSVFFLLLHLLFAAVFPGQGDYERLVFEYFRVAMHACKRQNMCDELHYAKGSTCFSSQLTVMIHVALIDPAIVLLLKMLVLLVCVNHCTL
jgi:hypothetical protein